MEDGDLYEKRKKQNDIKEAQEAQEAKKALEALEALEAQEVQKAKKAKKAIMADILAANGFKPNTNSSGNTRPQEKNINQANKISYKALLKTFNQLKYDATGKKIDELKNQKNPSDDKERRKKQLMLLLAGLRDRAKAASSPAELRAIQASLIFIQDQSQDLGDFAQEVKNIATQINQVAQSSVALSLNQDIHPDQLPPNPFPTKEEVDKVRDDMKNENYMQSSNDISQRYWKGEDVKIEEVQKSLDHLTNMNDKQKDDAREFRRIHEGRIEYLKDRLEIIDQKIFANGNLETKNLEKEKEAHQKELKERSADLEDHLDTFKGIKHELIAEDKLIKAHQEGKSKKELHEIIELTKNVYEHRSNKWKELIAEKEKEILEKQKLLEDLKKNNPEMLLDISKLEKNLSNILLRMESDIDDHLKIEEKTKKLKEFKEGISHDIIDIINIANKQLSNIEHLGASKTEIDNFHKQENFKEKDISSLTELLEKVSSNQESNNLNNQQTHQEISTEPSAEQKKTTTKLNFKNFKEEMILEETQKKAVEIVESSKSAYKNTRSESQSEQRSTNHEKVSPSRGR